MVQRKEPRSAGQGSTAQGRAGQHSAGQGSTAQGRSSQGSTAQGRSSQGRAQAAAPCLPPARARAHAPELVAGADTVLYWSHARTGYCTVLAARAHAPDLVAGAVGRDDLERAEEEALEVKVAQLRFGKELVGQLPQAVDRVHRDAERGRGKRHARACAGTHARTHAGRHTRAHTTAGRAERGGAGCWASANASCSEQTSETQGRKQLLVIKLD
jgi:hypothetical protein